MITGLEREAYLAWSRTPEFRRQVDRACDIVRQAMEKGRVCASVSWGKDSTVLADLAAECGVRDAMHYHFDDSLPGYEIARDAFLARWPDVRYHVVQQRRTLEETIEWFREIGLPCDRDEEAQAAVVADVKKQGTRELCERHGWAVVLLGMRAEEAPTKRGKLFKRLGLTYRTAGVCYSNPLGWWKGRDVWAYIVSRDLAYNERTYDAQTHGYTREIIRSAGWLSPDGAGRGMIPWLRQHFPHQYRLLVTHFPEVRAHE